MPANVNPFWMKPASMRHSSTEDRAAWALSLLQPKHKLSRDLYVVWLLMLQKHMQKTITYLSLFLLRLVTRTLTQGLIPHTGVLLSRHAYSPFLPAWSPRSDALGPSPEKLLLYFAAAGSAVICEIVWCCGPDRKDIFDGVAALCHL